MKKVITILSIFLIVILTGCSSKKYSDDKALWNNVKTGDYVYLESDTSEYKIKKGESGYDKDQVIKTNELTIWRVIRVNKDLTVDMVSEYLPQNEIIINGLTGYNNLIGLLNQISFEYGNTKYVEKARNIGYSNQRENVEEIKSFKELMTLSWDEIKTKDYIETVLNLTTDDGYIEDLELVNKAIGTILASPESTPEHKYNGYFRYLVSSRTAEYSHLFPYINLYVREINDSTKSIDSIEKTTLYNCSSQYKECENISTVSERIRPILTMKRRVIIVSGDGSKENPYKLDIN